MGFLLLWLENPCRSALWHAEQRLNSRLKAIEGALNRFQAQGMAGEMRRG